MLMLAQAAHAKDADEQCKAYTLMREAGSESKRSKRAVLDVLENRMRKKRKSCKAVVSEPHQWSWYRRGMKLKVDKQGLTSFRTISTMRPVLKSCAEFFHSGEKPGWARKRKVVLNEKHLKFYC